MQEQEFFKQGNVSVSISRFIVDGQTYAMSGITSVRHGQVEPSRLGPLLLGALGLIMLAGDGAWKLLAVVFLGAAIAVWRLQQPEHTVLLSSSSGEAKALTSQDGQFIRGVVQALNECIVARG